MFSKIKKFLKDNDIRWILIKISKLIKINLYPKKFKFNILHKLHTKIIFNLIFFSKIFEKKRNTFKFIKKNVEFKSSEINFLVSTQSSGSNFLRGMINSYFELANDLGNGIPFYHIGTDRWIFNSPLIFFSDLWKSVNLDRNINFEKLNDDLKSEFLNKRIIFSRHPMVNTDLFDLDQNNINPILLIRDPKDWIVSRYIYLKNNSFYLSIKNHNTEINTKIIQDEFAKLNLFFSYWKKNLNNKKKYFVIDFNSLIKNPRDLLKKSLEFYNFKQIKEELLDKSVEYNSHNFIKNFYGNMNMKRFESSDKDKKINTKNKINDYVNDYLKESPIEEKYNFFLNKIK